MKWKEPLQMLRYTEDAADGVNTDKNHYLMLYALTHLVRPTTAIEIGSRRAGSAMWIAKAMEENGRGHLHCVDAFVDRHGGAAGFLWHFENNLIQVGLAHRVTLIKKLSGEAREEVPETCQLLFIDGDHSYEGCLADIQNYVPKVQSGGALIIHDVRTEAGVRQAINDSESLFSKYFQMEIENHQGIWMGVKL